MTLQPKSHSVPGFMGTSRPTDLVTEAGPQNSTVRAGLEADLWCKVRTTKSLAIAPFVQVWSLTQSYSVDFLKSRVCVNKCVFNKRTIKVCVSCC